MTSSYNTNRGQAILYRWPQGQLAVMIGCHINGGKFYLLLHLLMITDQMPVRIIWLAALNLSVTCECWVNIQYSGGGREAGWGEEGKEHLQVSEIRTNRTLCTHATWR